MAAVRRSRCRREPDGAVRSSSALEPRAAVRRPGRRSRAPRASRAPRGGPAGRRPGGRAPASPVAGLHAGPDPPRLRVRPGDASATAPCRRTGRGRRSRSWTRSTTRRSRRDLGVFDSQFGLPAPPSLKVVDQTGGNKLPRERRRVGRRDLAGRGVGARRSRPRPTSCWSRPTPTASTTCWRPWTTRARRPGVSVVSMSWGGSEFFSFNGKEFTGETADDPDFLTPAGHAGVTFVTAAGDNGPATGAG